MTHAEFIQHLEGEDACNPGIQLVKQCSSPQEAWEKCNRSEFMVWDLLTDERSRTAIETIERYIKGDATIEEL